MRATPGRPLLPRAWIASLLTAALLLVCGACDGSPGDRLAEAASLGDLAAVKQLLADGADPDAPDRFGEPPVFRAVEHGHTDVAEFLLRSGRRDQAWLDALLARAAQWCRPECARMLISEGARADQSTEPPGGLLRYALERDPSAVAAEMYFFERATPHKAFDVPAGFAEAHGITREGHHVLFATLIEHGADVEARDGAGNRPLHAAARERDPFYATALLAAGADVNAANEVGLTPLDDALRLGHGDVAALLRERGGTTGAELQASDEEDE